MLNSSDNTIFTIKNDNDEDFSVVIEAITGNELADSIKDIESQQVSLEQKLAQLNEQEYNLTNHTDGLDYTIAVASGILCGLLDSFFVGKFDFEVLKADAHKQVNQFIEKYAKLRGFKGNGLKGSIQFLENKFPIAQDNIWKGKDISSTKLHHLEDLAHHPTPFGLVMAIVITFFRVARFDDKDGNKVWIGIPSSKEDILKIWTPILITGILRWLVYVAESKYKDNIDKEIPKPLHKLIVLLSYSPAIIEILKVADNWCGHLVSDMGGSKNTAGGGMGIAGIFLSLLKEISSLPGINKTALPKIVSDWYSKGHFDMRHEIAIMKYAGKQSIPVLINEALVRTFYFVRHLLEEKKDKAWSNIDWNKIKPWNNRTIARMLTIATGTFSAADLLDAAIRSAVENGGNIYNPKLYADFVLRINFVGLGRFAIAAGTDIRMGVNRSKTQKEIIADINAWLAYQNCKICLRNTEMWQATLYATKDINELYEGISKSMPLIQELNTMCQADLDAIRTYRSGIEKHNPEILKLLDKKPF